jgi:hypothetical protein
MAAAIYQKFISVNISQVKQFLAGFTTSGLISSIFIISGDLCPVTPCVHWCSIRISFPFQIMEGEVIKLHAIQLGLCFGNGFNTPHAADVTSTLTDPRKII